ncbi:hypothetical protein D9M69_732350 [compost metagenome]
MFDIVFLTMLQQPVQVHLYPGRHAADQRQVFIHGFYDDARQLIFPVFDTIRFIRRELVIAHIRRYMVIDNAT